MLKLIKSIMLDRYKATAVLFIIFIIFIFFGMFLNVKSIGYSVLEGYKNHLPENYNTLDVIEATIKSAENGINDSVINKRIFVDFNGLLQGMMDKRIVEDVDEHHRVYKMNNGQLTFNYPEYDITPCVESYTRLYDIMTLKGIDMLYVQGPCKNDKYDNQLPKGVLDTTNKNMDYFLGGLAHNGIPYVDLREAFRDMDIYSNLFYNTDHHWKTETAFLAYSHVMEYLSTNLQVEYDEDYTNITNFTELKLNECFLGSQGRRAGQYYSGVDNYTLIIPDFQTNFSVKTIYYDGTIKSEITGDFNEAIVKYEFFKANAPISTDRYASYFGGNFPLIGITNHNENDGRILVVQDSYGLPFSAFLSLHFKQTDILDLRHFKDQSLYEYLDKNNYDTVLFLYNPGVFSSGQVQFMFE